METFNYQISGGLEPGESAEWKLAPGMFGSWGSVEIKPDMAFTVVAKRVDDADGQKLFAVDWTEKDEERLASLIARASSDQHASVIGNH